MPGGAYSALTGMQARLQSLDRIAADLANINTAGYKTERTTRFVAERDFAAALDSAVDVTSGGTRTDLMPGSITNTGRSLDVAIDGQGFFAIQTPNELVPKRFGDRPLLGRVIDMGVVRRGEIFHRHLRHIGRNCPSLQVANRPAYSQTMP